MFENERDAGARAMSHRLLFRTGSSGLQTGETYLLDRDETTLGRAIDNDLVISDERASRYHAKIVRESSTYVLFDLNSRNGTLVQGQRVLGPHRLSHGDLVVIPGLIFTFQEAGQDDTLAEEPLSGLKVNLAAASAFLDGQQLHLTSKEFRALALLYRKAGDLCTKSELAQQVWPEYDGNVGDYNIEQLISRLRRKLNDNSREPRHLLTIRGLGYRLPII
jgi:hypothetical protein